MARDAEISHMSQIRRASNIYIYIHDSSPGGQAVCHDVPKANGKWEIKVCEWEGEGGETGKETERDRERHRETWRE